MMDNMKLSLKRKKLFYSVDTLLTTYCKGCLIYKHLKNEKGKCSAHKFCITQCTVGDQIQELGKKIISLKGTKE
jgi:Zinc-finger